MKRTAQIFLCYAHEDEAKVKELYNKLFSNGFKPWMDKIDLVGGEEWQFAIQQAILQSDFFIACVSSCWSEGKRRFFRREIKTALDVLPEMQTGDIYIIPLRLDECDVPESLMLFHWIDYFHDDGWERLAKSIQRGMERLGIAKPVRLRSYPLNELLEEDVIKMLKEKDFSDAFLNRSGKALKHQYEMKELQGEKL